MKNFNHTQLELNFKPRRCHVKTAADRILEAYHQIQRKEYFREMRVLRRDRFISMFGTQIF